MEELPLGIRRSRPRCRRGLVTCTRTCSWARTAGRWSTPGSARTRRRSGRRHSTGRGRADPRHPLPSGSRRRRRRPRADARARPPGGARLRAVRARLGTRTARADRRLFRNHGVPDEITEELIGSGDVYRPFIRFQRDPILVDDGDWLDVARGARRRPRPRRRAALPAWLTGSSSRPTTCSAASRPRSASGRRVAPTRSATSSSRSNGRSSSRPRSRCPARRTWFRPVGRARELIEHHRERLGLAEAAPSPPSRGAPTRSLPDSSAPSPSPRHAVSPSRDALAPRAPSCWRSARSGSRTSESLPILRASLDEPSSTHAPESGA